MLCPLLRINFNDFLTPNLSSIEKVVLNRPNIASKYLEYSVTSNANNMVVMKNNPIILALRILNASDNMFFWVLWGVYRPKT